MTDTDEIIRQLEETADGIRKAQRYQKAFGSGANASWHEANLADAVAALSRHASPRIIPWERLWQGGTYDFGYMEVRDVKEIFPVILSPETKCWSPKLCSDGICLKMATREEYRKECRVWTTRPSEAVRKETPWRT